MNTTKTFPSLRFEQRKFAKAERVGLYCWWCSCPIWSLFPLAIYSLFVFLCSLNVPRHPTSSTSARVLFSHERGLLASPGFLCLRNLKSANGVRICWVSMSWRRRQFILSSWDCILLSERQSLISGINTSRSCIGILRFWCCPIWSS